MTVHRGAASTLLRETLAGPRKAARILGSGPFCCYLDVTGSLLAVECSDAIQLPRSVRLTVPAGSSSFAHLEPGMTASVGENAVTFPGLTVTVTRWWAPRRCRPGLIGVRVERLSSALATGPPPVDVALPVADLLGRGEGLTPAGDDVLAGMLLAARTEPVLVAALFAEVEAVGLRRTTLLSGALIRDAAAGYGVPAVLDLVEWLSGRGTDSCLELLTGRVLALGNTSGTALAWGVARGARSALESAGRGAAA